MLHELFLHSYPSRFVFEGVQITVRINQNILSLGKIEFHKNMTDPAKGWQLILNICLELPA